MKSGLIELLKSFIPKEIWNKLKKFNILNGKKIELSNKFLPNKVSYKKKVILPPKEQRFCGAKFRVNEYYLSSAQSEAIRLVKHFGLTLNSSILDVGCGQGRLAIGLYSKVGEINYYHGVDVDMNSIQWCQKNITRYHPSFKFTHLNLKNIRYNPAGEEIKSNFRLPFNDQRFDVIYLYSVFTHMIIEDIKVYLEEFYRILTPSGKIFLTAYIEKGVPNISINPPNYILEWSAPLHCVRYENDFFEKILAQFNFKIDRFDPGREDDGQSGLYLSKSKNINY